MSDLSTEVRLHAAPRRGLNRVEAAAYIGVSPSKFDELVTDGRMPKPIAIDRRKVWDIRELDLCFDALREVPCRCPFPLDMG